MPRPGPYLNAKDDHGTFFGSPSKPFLELVRDHGEALLARVEGGIGNVQLGDNLAQSIWILRRDIKFDDHRQCDPPVR